MTDYKPLIKYNLFENKVSFPRKISSYTIADFAAAIAMWLKKRPSDILTLEFSSVVSPYSNGMLPIIATVHNLRSKAGVTRNKQVGQGNGLAGTLRITTMTGGSIDIASGAGRFYSTMERNHRSEGKPEQSFAGTSVSGYLKMNKNFSIGEALNFNGRVYVPATLVNLKYEMEDQDCLFISMKTETTGFGTRHAGRQMRTKILNLVNAHPNYPVYVDWEGVPVISSSFADEVMGKLFLELGPINFSTLVRNKSMELLVKQLLDKAIMQRLAQAN